MRHRSFKALASSYSRKVKKRSRIRASVSPGSEYKMIDETRPRIPIKADWVLKRIQEGKKVRLRNAIIEGELDLNILDLPTQRMDRTELQKLQGLKEDVKIVQSSIKINNSTIKGMLDFSNSVLIRDAMFEGTTFNGNAEFEGAIFKEDASFDGATFCQYAGFNDVTFGFSFFGAVFNGFAWFEGATFSEMAFFYNAIFSKNATFKRATFSGHPWFEGAKFEGDVLTFRDATFIEAEYQEEACRKAKNVLEKNGDREEAAYHFYREMDGKRKQKPWYYRYPEFIFLQLIFGYGVHPWWLMYWWLVIIFVFANIYSIGNGIDGTEHWIDYIKISFAIAIAPGYIAAIINPASAGYKLISIYQAVAIIETIVGTFLWAGFIATFAKKYMK